jgi:hypothetical protein
MKNKSYILPILVTLILISCTDSIQNHPQKYDEVPLRNWVNQYYAESQEPNYKDNKIYNGCLEVIYEYHYEKNNETKYFKQDVILSDWEFITEEELNNGIGIKRIKLTAENPNDNYDNPPQSAIEYELLNSKNVSIGIESTGVVENYWNIALHNTRSGFFQALFSFPWPSIKFPVEKNKTWNWNFSYSSELYGDDRIFNWDNITEMKYTYSYLGEESLNLKFGRVNVSKFEAIGTDSTLTNKLVYYFNSQIGFVKQIFFTDDGAKIELEAVEYNNKCE